MTNEELRDAAWAELEQSEISVETWLYRVAHGYRGQPYNWRNTHIGKAKLLLDQITDPEQPTTNVGVGVHFHGQWPTVDTARRDKILDLIADAGIEWVRIDVEWRYIEQTGKSQYNGYMLGKYDDLFKGMRDRGLKILGVIMRTPDWANPAAANKPNGEMPPLNRMDYADFCGWSMNRWMFDASEIWNEEDPSQTFWRGTPQQYVDLLKVAYSALKSAKPTAPVVLGGVSTNYDTYLKTLYDLGAKPYFDVLATHPYQTPSNLSPSTSDSPPERWNYMHYPAVLALMQANGDGDKPVWFTEFGYSTHPTAPGADNSNKGVSEQQQADYLLKAIEIAEGWPNVENLFIYKIDDDRVSNEHIDNYGLVKRDYTPKLAYKALKELLTV